MCGQRGRNMTVIVAISDQVGVACILQGEWGGLTAGVFRDFLTILGIVLGDEPATVARTGAPQGAEPSWPITICIQSASWRHTRHF